MAFYVALLVITRGYLGIEMAMTNDCSVWCLDHCQKSSLHWIEGSIYRFPHGFPYGIMILLIKYRGFRQMFPWTNPMIFGSVVSVMQSFDWWDDGLGAEPNAFGKALHHYPSAALALRWASGKCEGCTGCWPSITLMSRDFDTLIFGPWFGGFDMFFHSLFGVAPNAMSLEFLWSGFISEIYCGILWEHHFG